MNAYVGDPAKTATFHNKKSGEPIEVDGVPVWTTSDTTVLIVTPSADGLSCSLGFVGAGTAKVGLVIDGDLGEGVQELTASLDVTVEARPEVPEPEIVVA